MSDHTYKCSSAVTTANRIWQADFYHGSYNELVESKDPDRIIASVGLGEISGPDRKVSMLVTLQNHKWSKEIAEILIDEIILSEPPLSEWDISYKNLSWTFRMTWRT